MAGGAGGLVGRAGELKVVSEALTALDDQPAGRILTIVGEPGVGKSRLLDALCLSADDLGHLVLRGRAAEFERELPFGLVVDALEDFLASFEPQRLAEIAAEAAAELGMAVPAFMPIAGRDHTVIQAERYRTYRAVRGLLARLGERQPLVLALDDVHWADPASVELLGHLLAYPPSGRVLIVMAYRPGQVPPRLDHAADDAVVQQRADRLELAPFTADEADELLGPGLSRAVRQDLYRESGGNPFYLQQLLRVAGGGRVVPDAETQFAGAGTANVPPAVRTALSSELACLSAPARTLVQAAAVAGDPFAIELAAAGAAMEESEALDILDELVEHDLVRPTFVPRRFSFRHPIVRRAVYESAGAGWRVASHARVATALAARGAAPSAFAHHVERSASEGDQAAIAVLVEAGDATATRSPAAAAHWYAGALRLLPRSPEHESRRLGLLVSRATALGASGQLEESHVALCQGLEHLPDDDATRVGITAFLAGVEHLLGRHHQARERLLEAHRALEDHRSPEAVALEVELAAAGGFLTKIDEMNSWGERALAGSRALGLRPLEATAAALVAYARYSQGLPASTAVAHAASLFDALDDDELAGRLDAPLWLGFAEGLLERFDDAIRHCDRAIALSRATGQGAYLLGTMTAKVWALLGTGRLAEATRLADEAVEAFRLAPNAFLAEAVGFASLAATLRGDLATALRLGEEAVQLSRNEDPGVMTAAAGVWFAVALIEMGEASPARDAVLAASGGPELPLLARACRCIAYEVLTRAELALGHLEAADTWARQAEAAMYGAELGVEAGFARRAMASVSLARGDGRHAADVALAAASDAAAAGSPVEAGRSRLLAARALAHAGEREQAIAELGRAERDLEAHGAQGYAEQVRKELRRLGRRGRRRSGTEAKRLLTEREQEIAALVCQGRTNREIALACYVSEKTVERHLSSLFAKLGVSKRAAVAGALQGRFTREMRDSPDVVRAVWPA